MAEWSNAAVLKTVEVKASGGSNPSPSANKRSDRTLGFIASFYIVKYGMRQCA